MSTKFVKTWLKGWKYLDEAIDFAKESWFARIDEAEIIRTNSTGLSDLLILKMCCYVKSMKNKMSNKSR